MKKIILFTLVICMVLPGMAQKRYYTKTGKVSFAAGTAMEDIDGVSNTVASVFDANTGQIEYAVLIRGFEFKRALMQEHFNENYLESDRFPKSIFKGNIIDAAKVNFAKDGEYPVTVKGILDMHGVKKEIETPGTLKVSGETVRATASFSVLLADYNISIPGLVKDKISKTVNIKVDCNYSVLK